VVGNPNRSINGMPLVDFLSSELYVWANLFPRLVHSFPLLFVGMDARRSYFFSSMKFNFQRAKKVLLS